MLAFGSSSGSTGASTARPTTSAIHAIDNQAVKPRPRFRRLWISGPVSTAAISMVPGSIGRPWAASPRSPRIGSGPSGIKSGAGVSGSGTADPRVEHDVERVDREIEKYITDGDDGDVALE